MPATPPPALPPTPLIEPGFAEVRRLDLQAAFHTKAPWSVYALAPTGSDADTGDKPVKICFQQSPAAKPDCTSLTSGLDNDTMIYPYQTFGSLRIEPLSPARKGVVATASFSGGGSGSLSQTAVWTPIGGKSDGFILSSTIKVDNLGEDRRFASGPLAGYYVVADFLWGEHETHWDPHRFAIEAYKLAPSGAYVEVLRYVTTRKYPAERQTEDYVIDHELPRLKRRLHTVYPKGALF
jgi:hypothetical protein